MHRTKSLAGNVDRGQFFMDNTSSVRTVLERADIKKLLEVFIGADFSQIFSK
jgi:hypothetical protein